MKREARSQDSRLRARVCTGEPQIELSVVIPTYNERENVGCLVSSLEAALAGIEWQAIFVDDNSPDGTADLLRALATQNRRVYVIERIGRRGLSSACIEGISMARTPYVAVMDADLQHDERILPEMLRRLKSEDVDMVVASRTIPGGSMGKFPLPRVWLSNVGRMFTRLVCHCGVSDTMSGFFIIRRDFFQRVVHKLSGRGFKLLFDLLASSGFPVNVVEVPYRFRSRQRGGSKLGATVELQFLYLLADKVIHRRMWAHSVHHVVEPTVEKCIGKARIWK